MSWDVLLVRLPDEVTSVSGMAHDYVPAPLGSRHDVLATVARVLPEADLSDPAWGDLSGPTWSIELGIGARDPVDSMMLHIRGAGDDVLTPVFELAGALGCKVFDCSAGDLIAPGGPSGWHGFQRFRDQVVGRAGDPGGWRVGP
ncbi:Hypothetical protein B591_11300 [Streptomyces sp. GBA 94-10 4N24]|uniref:hypothetical protein n=1 Tax=Streptomyces sp. GBA 94-10 4N24 TaxID=1218177 RepID=UPI0003C2D82B|nr:hypothetical protein [Streptomyces sp. GBA 94-10 4N24]ESQ00300.1 Hypothetical protein B591_11300 [Streptomyces sp. GBA 94-10 4N24]UZN59252.1 Hypothetical protein B591N_11300 [Streptomyces sp. GBA 94-10 4N24]